MGQIPIGSKENTTLQDNTTLGFTGIAGNMAEELTDEPSIFQIILIIVIGAFSFFGNLLIIRVLYNLPNTRLKKTTKVLLCYVSASFCIFSVLMSGRLLDIPCSIVALGAVNAGFNAVCGMFLLTYEAFVMVEVPLRHRKFVSMNIIKVGILFSWLASLCLDIAAYKTMKEPDDPSVCYMTNGKFSPSFLIIAFSLFGAMIMGTSTLQICTLRAVKKVIPLDTGTSIRSITISHIGPSPPVVPGPVAIQNNTSAGLRNGRKSSLHKLITIMSVSLLCFIICWSPSTICICIFSMCELLNLEVVRESEILSALSSLVIFNGGLHVVVYFSMSSQLRKAVIKYLNGWLCLGSN